MRKTANSEAMSDEKPIYKMISEHIVRVALCEAMLAMINEFEPDYTLQKEFLAAVLIQHSHSVKEAMKAVTTVSEAYFEEDEPPRKPA